MSLGLSQVARVSGLSLLAGLQTCSPLTLFSQVTAPQATPAAKATPQPGAGQPTSTMPPGASQALTPAALESRSRSITVKLLLQDTWGSGILVYRQGQRYLVLTNQHVVASGQNYRVQTPDGRIYPASTYGKTNFQGNDLALVEFNSTQNYAIAKLGSSRSLRVGSAVFATGFPLNASGKAAASEAETTAQAPAAQPHTSQPQAAQNRAGSSPPTVRRQDGFQFTQGRVSLLNNKPFEGGYQVGYSNAIVKGMSGGPVLNAQGVVVGVNGMQAYPLWGNPYVFRDGTQPPAKHIDLSTRSSWAIPVETFLNLAPEGLRLALTKPMVPATPAKP
jgi:serine protease Do